MYILKTKDQVVNDFCNWKALVEKENKRKLKTLRTDNSGEYTSNEFKKFLRDEGIRHERGIPKTPEQNRVSQIGHRLSQQDLYMLLDANLSKRYLAEAVSTATYLKNRCPTKAVQGKTPWNGEKPKVCNLRVFGCDAYTHIPKDERGKHGNVFLSGMVKKPKGIDSMMSQKERPSTVETYSFDETPKYPPHYT